MQLPRWYAESGTIDLGEYEAEALPFRRRLVDDGELLPLKEVSDRWADRSESEGAANGFFYVEVDGCTYAPAFFLDPTLSPKDLTEITGLLGTLPGWSKWHFFTSRKASLAGATPLDALKEGKLERVKRAARGFAER
jgi:hypothetical protein